MWKPIKAVEREGCRNVSCTLDADYWNTELVCARLNWKELPMCPFSWLLALFKISLLRDTVWYYSSKIWTCAHIPYPVCYFHTRVNDSVTPIHNCHWSCHWMLPCFTANGVDTLEVRITWLGNFNHLGEFKVWMFSWKLHAAFSMCSELHWS